DAGPSPGGVCLGTDVAPRPVANAIFALDGPCGLTPGMQSTTTPRALRRRRRAPATEATTARGRPPPGGARTAASPVPLPRRPAAGVGPTAGSHARGGRPSSALILRGREWIAPPLHD